MAESISMSTANSILDAIFNNVSYAVATPYLQLHVGAPGSAGTANVATETTRKLVPAGSPGSGAIANDTAISWTGLPTADPEDITHWSLWTASSAGTFVMSGTFVANPIQDGDTLTIAIGDLDVAFTTAS